MSTTPVREAAFADEEIRLELRLVAVDEAFDKNGVNVDNEFDGDDEGDGEDVDDPLQIAHVWL